MVRAAVLVLLLACERSPSSASPPAPRPSVSSGAAAGAQPVSTREDVPPLTTTVRDGEGKCEPQPRAGSPCGAGDSYCVVSWGKPGGFSSALWCRDGRWEREEEANLPE